MPRSLAAMTRASAVLRYASSRKRSSVAMRDSTTETPSRSLPRVGLGRVGGGCAAGESNYLCWAVSVAVLVTPAYEAEMVMLMSLLTAVVVTVKVLELLPAGTTTLGGTRACFGCELVKVTRAPLAGAGPVSVTVPVEALPPTTLAGLSTRVVSAAATAGLT